MRGLLKWNIYFVRDLIKMYLFIGVCKGGGLEIPNSIFNF